jgi:hypothetical protein
MAHWFVHPLDSFTNKVIYDYLEEIGYGPFFGTLLEKKKTSEGRKLKMTPIYHVKYEHIRTFERSMEDKNLKFRVLIGRSEMGPIWEYKIQGKGRFLWLKKGSDLLKKP